MHIFVFPILLLLNPNPFERFLTYLLCKPKIDAGTLLSGHITKTPFLDIQLSPNFLDILPKPNLGSGEILGFF